MARKFLLMEPEGGSNGQVLMRDSTQAIGYKWGDLPSGVTVSRIYVGTAPTKTAYKAGEVFDPAGMVIKADYTNGSQVIVQGVIITGWTADSSPLVAGQASVTIQYTESRVTYSCTQAISVTKTDRTVPRVIGTYTYDGTEQTATLSGFDSSVMSKAGDLAATNAGAKHITVSLLHPDLDQWADGSTTDKDVPWEIEKATPALSVSPTAVTLDTSHLTATATVTTDGDGSFATPTSSNTGVATATISNKTVTISHVNRTTGTATITVRQNEGTNYLGGSVTIAVTASFVSAVLNDNSWDTISSVGAAGNGSSYWSVGDAKSVALNGTVGTLSLNTTLWAFIVHFNYNGVNGVYFQGFKTAQTGGTDVCLVDDTYGSNAGSNGAKKFAMNHWGGSSSPYNTNYGGWAACDLRYDILGSTNQAPTPYGSTKTTSATGKDPTSTCATSPVANTLMAALPSDLRAVMKPWTVWTGNKGNSDDTAAGVTSTVDYLPLPAEVNVHGGNRTYANQYEKTKESQWTYYANGNSKIKYRHDSTGSAAAWWCRSPPYTGANGFCRVNADGTAGLSGSRYSYGLAPAFRVA